MKTIEKKLFCIEIDKDSDLWGVGLAYAKCDNNEKFKHIIVAVLFCFNFSFMFWRRKL